MRAVVTKGFDDRMKKTLSSPQKRAVFQKENSNPKKKDRGFAGPYT
jgi:hypothetical protein